jgi:CubicO group peptidase (beta-lactamase class C family)
MSRPIILPLLACLLCMQTLAADLPVAAPASVGMSGERLARIDAAVGESIARRETPGAIVLAARRGRVVWKKAYGARAIEPEREALTTDTIFDAASLTKVVATATSIMILVERGQVRLNDPLLRYLPEVKGEGRERVTIEQLLTHRAGYAPDFDLGEQWTGYDEAMKRLATERLHHPAGTRFVYSDIGFIALGEVVRRVSGEALDVFARRNIFEPLGMRDTSFNPSAVLRPRIAPTEKRRAQAAYLGGRAESLGAEGERWLRGEVHDPTAFRMNGVAGHAGLFTTADDLAIYCQMILQGGEYAGVRVLSPLGVAAMTRPRAVGEDGAARGLGWDIASSFSNNRGDLFPPGSFGHTGFTGTSLWLDPASETFVVFLSNRVHPDGKGDVTALRGRVASIAASSLTDTTAEQSRIESARFASEVLLSLARMTGASNATANVALNAGATTSAETDAEVLNGIDVLARDNFKQLAGLRIGLVTNHTGRDRRGRQTIDVLREAANVKLVALFSPEHGIRGLLDEKVSDAKDEKTGLPIYSLYGETRRPKAGTVERTRCHRLRHTGHRHALLYLYLDARLCDGGAARARLPVFVLDRPNPIGGSETEGPLADADKLSFTGYHAIPVRHGMTIGELARFFNEERKINCDLRVVGMERWRRAMWFDATGQTWINPSPNMRSLTEGDLVSGRGAA